MSTDNEREIRGRLDAALGTITPPRPPLEATLRHGRTIRLRRRAAVAAGLAAVIGLGIALPGLVTHVGATPSLTPAYRLTVNPPRDTPGKLTFSGTINGRGWRLYVDWFQGKPMLTGPGVAWNQMNDVSPDGAPANLSTEDNGRESASAGQVRRDVAYLALIMPNGSAVDFRPVRWHGALWEAFELPTRLHPRSIVAYSRRGELAYTVPFGVGLINTWLRPGQPGLRRQSVTVATGVLDHRHWVYRGYAGPWGICFTNSDGSGSCLGDGWRLRRHQLLAWQGCGAFGRAADQFWNGQAAKDVGYLEFRLADGSKRRVVPVSLAGQRFFGLAFGTGQRPTGWTAYGAAGQVLGRGSVAPQC